MRRRYRRSAWPAGYRRAIFGADRQYPLRSRPSCRAATSSLDAQQLMAHRYTGTDQCRSCRSDHSIRARGRYECCLICPYSVEGNEEDTTGRIECRRVHCSNAGRSLCTFSAYIRRRITVQAPASLGRVTTARMDRGGRAELEHQASGGCAGSGGQDIKGSPIPAMAQA